MAKTITKPGPKPRYGDRRDYHIKLTVEDGLAEAFEFVAQKHGGVVAYAEKIIREQKEVADYMRYGDNEGRLAKTRRDEARKREE